MELWLPEIQSILPGSRSFSRHEPLKIGNPKSKVYSLPIINFSGDMLNFRGVYKEVTRNLTNGGGGGGKSSPKVGPTYCGFEVEIR